MGQQTQHHNREAANNRAISKKSCSTLYQQCNVCSGRVSVSHMLQRLKLQQSGSTQIVEVPHQLNAASVIGFCQQCHQVSIWTIQR